MGLDLRDRDTTGQVITTCADVVLMTWWVTTALPRTVEMWKEERNMMNRSKERRWVHRSKVGGGSPFFRFVSFGGKIR